MKGILLITCIAIAGLQSCKGQPKNEKKEIYNKDFNWKIEIPEGFQNLTSDQYASLQEKGTDALEKTYKSKIDNQSKRIFAFKSDRFHFFEANQQPFDPATDGEYINSCKSVDNVLYNTLKSQMPEGKIDSTISTEVINQLTFQRFKVQILLPNKVTLNLFMFSRLFNKKELTISIVYVDEVKGELLLNAFRNSKFE